MKTSTITWIVMVVLVGIGGWFLWSVMNSTTAQAPGDASATGSSYMGIKGSPNQTNMGKATETPSVQP